MSSLLTDVRRHLGVSIPLAVVYAGAVLLAARGQVDGLTLGVLLGVGALTLLAPVAIGHLNRRIVRGSWAPPLAAGERVLHDGAADLYELGFVGWLFLSDRRLLLCRMGGAEVWSAPLGEVAAVRSGGLAGVLATDLVVEMRDGSTTRLKVEGSGEWVERAGSALSLAREEVGR